MPWSRYRSLIILSYGALANSVRRHPRNCDWNLKNKNIADAISHFQMERLNRLFVPEHFSFIECWENPRCCPVVYPILRKPGETFVNILCEIHLIEISLTF